MAGIYDPNDPDYLAPSPRTLSGQINGPMALNTASMGDRTVTVPRQVAGMGAILPQPVNDFIGNATDFAKNAVANFRPFGLPGATPPAPTGINPAPQVALSPPASRGNLDMSADIGVTGARFAPPPPAPGAITRVGNSFSGTGAPPPPALDGMTDAQRNNAPFHQDYLAMQDRDRVAAAQADQNAQAGLRDQRLIQNEYDARVAAQKTGREADHAAFESSINAGAGRGNSRTRGATQLAADNANAGAQGRLATAQTALAGGENRDFLGELGKGEEIVGRGAASRSATALGNAKAQELQLGVEHQQRVNSIGAQLASETDPKKVATLQNSLLVMLGKDPKNFSVTRIEGGQYQPDPTNPLLVLKRPDTLAVTDNRTGEVVHTLGVGGQQQPSNGGYGSLQEAHDAAKKAIAGGMSVADANARLKQAGLPELQ